MSDTKSDSSDSDDSDLNIWSTKTRQKFRKFDRTNSLTELADNSQSGQCTSNEKAKNNSSETNSRLLRQYQKFDELKERASDIKKFSAQRRLISEQRRSRRLVKKALKDPFINELVKIESGNQLSPEQNIENKHESWKEIKPFLTINEHIQGPIPHGDCGPKTELECIVEDAIKEGDFEKAELLSDTLANREFAVKITKAFAAKRCYDKLEEQKAVEKAKQSKKIRWTFEAKERWQMKGNM